MSEIPDVKEQHLRIMAMEIAARLPEAPHRAHRVLDLARELQGFVCGGGSLGASPVDQPAGASAVERHSASQPLVPRAAETERGPAERRAFLLNAGAA